MSETISVFDAISYDLRRDIIDLLFESPRTINEISENFSISRQAVTKHLKILQDAKLLCIENRGRERICSVSPEPLVEVNEWLKTYDKFWDEKLEDLKDYLEND